MSLTVGSLFSGIGGLELGLERSGMRVVWQSEIDPFCSEVLAKHWPHVPNLGDVTKIKWEDVERVDLICGGFPCQPVSIAGRRRAQDDERWLWPEVERAVRVLLPRFVLLENVPGLLTAGFGDVLGDLAAFGYDAEWDCIPAAAVGAPHLRDRLFAVAWQRSELGWSWADRDDGGSLNTIRTGWDAVGDGGTDVADTDVPRRGQRRGTVTVSTEQRSAERCREDVADTEGERWGRRIFTRPYLVEHGSQPSHGDAGAGRDGERWAAEPDVGRVAHGIPSRVDRLRGLGNAVVPQVAEHIGRQLLAVLDRSVSA